MKVFLVLTVAALAGCATPQIMVKPGASVSEMNRDAAQCEYEAAGFTANYNTGRTAPTMSGAFAQGFGEGLAIAVRREELRKLCLRAKGYVSAGPVPPAPFITTRVATASEIASAPSVTAPPQQQASGSTGTPYPIDRGAAPVKQASSKYLYTAEQYAKANGCQGPVAQMTFATPGAETFSISCSNSDPLVVRCDFGQSRSLKQIDIAASHESRLSGGFFIRVV